VRRDSAEVPTHLVRASFNGTPAFKFDLVEQVVDLIKRGPAAISRHHPPGRCRPRQKVQRPSNGPRSPSADGGRCA
jgi:hypothetical protein